MTTPHRANGHRRAVAEIAAVVVAALVHVAATQWLDAYPFDIAVIGGAFVGYAVLQLRRHDVRVAWGLRRDGLGACARDAAAWSVAGTAVLLALRLGLGW